MHPEKELSPFPPTWAPRLFPHLPPRSHSQLLLSLLEQVRFKGNEKDAAYVLTTALKKSKQLRMLVQEAMAGSDAPDRKGLRMLRALAVAWHANMIAGKKKHAQSLLSLAVCVDGFTEREILSLFSAEEIPVGVGDRVVVAREWRYGASRRKRWRRKVRKRGEKLQSAAEVVAVSADGFHVRVRYLNAYRGHGDERSERPGSDGSAVARSDVLRLHACRLNRSMLHRAKFHAETKFPGAAPDIEMPKTVARISKQQYGNTLQFFAREDVTGILKAKKENVKRGSELELQQIPTRLWATYLHAYPAPDARVGRSTFLALARINLFQVKSESTCVCEMCKRFGIDGFCELKNLVSEIEADFDPLVQDGEVEKWGTRMQARIKRTCRHEPAR